MRAAHSLCMSYKRELNENKKKLIQKSIMKKVYDLIVVVM